jgi:hypothetical protein
MIDFYAAEMERRYHAGLGSPLLIDLKAEEKRR